jgi:hypothetical protein
VLLLAGATSLVLLRVLYQYYSQSTDTEILLVLVTGSQY